MPGERGKAGIREVGQGVDSLMDIRNLGPGMENEGANLSDVLVVDVLLAFQDFNSLFNSLQV